MRYLTFLDYSALESGQKSIEDKLIEREKEIFVLKQNDFSKTDAIAGLSDRLNQISKDMEAMKKEMVRFAK
jgi:hypothetical protein